eukprot:s1234_g3.t1
MAKGTRSKHLVPAQPLRPLEPRVLNGRGMRVLGFVPAHGSLVTKPLAATAAQAAPSTTKLCREDPAVSVKGPSAWKKGKPLYAHGNYGSYYSYRHSPEDVQGDRRLVALSERLGKDFLKGKEVLDIGCNSGLVSISAACHFSARRVVGMDLDSGLIQAAKEHLQSLEGESRSVEFRAEDILTCPLRRHDQPERFDVVLCLSVTKWIHFAHGDTGLHNLFKRCFKRTRPGGYFVLEPQEWGSYKKKRHLTREIRQTVAKIQIRPEDFEDYLQNAIGFEKVDVIEPPGDLPPNFQRRLRIFRRPLEEEEEVQQPEAKPRKRKRAA